MFDQIKNYPFDAIEIEICARLAHQNNKAYCEAIGDNSQVDWNEAPMWQKNSAIAGVQFVFANPDAPPSASHDSWLEVKRNEGWKYGPVKDVEKKEHPCFVPYEELPQEQKVKDFLFKGLVLEFAKLTIEHS